MMLVLGIESTAHTFGIGVVDENCNVLCDIRYVYAPKRGGIHPKEAWEHHLAVAPEAVMKAATSAPLQRVDAIAFSAGPGLGPALRVGGVVSRTLAEYHHKPLVPVHHGIAHIELAIKTVGAEDPLVVLVSGGHTLVTAFVDGRWRVFGETLDITLGNLLDQLGRALGYPSPAGAQIEALAKKGAKLLNFSYTVKGNDIVLSGLLTEAKKALKKYDPEDVCFSVQEVAFSMIVEVAERALAQLGKGEIVIAGGVAANERLREMFAEMASQRGAKFYACERKYSADNGVQIAWTGLLAFSAGVSCKPEEGVVRQRWRLDDVPIPWRG